MGSVFLFDRFNALKRRNIMKFINFWNSTKYAILLLIVIILIPSEALFASTVGKMINDMVDSGRQIDREDRVQERYQDGIDSIRQLPPLPTQQYQRNQYNQVSSKSVDIINSTSLTIVQIYGSRVGSGEWYALSHGLINLLPGYTMTATIFDKSSCVYDFRFVFNTGDQFVKQFVNVCDGSTLTIYNK